MIEAVKSELRLELQAFSRLGATNKLSSITDSYTRILAIVQAIMVSSDNPDAHARAWSLINDDAYKYLVEVGSGLTALIIEEKLINE